TSRRELVVSDFGRLAVDGVAGFDFDGRRDALVPFVMDFALVERVFACCHADIINGPNTLGTEALKGRLRMKRSVLIILGVLAVSTNPFAQTNDEVIERALSAAPRQMKEGATVIKWKADGTYDTLKKGTNKLVCYDRSGEPGYQPFAVQCTSLANLDRVAQNRKFDKITD